MKRSRKWRSAQLNKRRARLKGGALLHSLGVPSWLQNYFPPSMIERLTRGASHDYVLPAGRYIVGSVNRAGLDYSNEPNPWPSDRRPVIIGPPLYGAALHENIVQHCPTCLKPFRHDGAEGYTCGCS